MVNIYNSFSIFEPVLLTGVFDMNNKLLVGLSIMVLVTSQPLLALMVGATSDDGSGATSSRTGPRAIISTWTDTDWSNGNVNASNNIEADLTPGEAVLSSDPSDMTELFAPGTTGNIMVFSMADFKGAIVMAVGATPGTDIYTCDLITLLCSKVTHLDESMINEMTVSANGSRLYIPGGGPLTPPPYGSVYFYNGTTVTRHEVKDISTHSMGVGAVVEVGGKIYATSTDNDKIAYVYRSLDDGATWTKLPVALTAKPYPRRFNAMGVVGGTIYIQNDGLAPEGPKVIRYNGTWASEAVPGSVNRPGAITEVNGTPYLLTGGLLFKFSGGTWAQVPSPISPYVSQLETYNTATKTFRNVSDLLLGRRSHTSDLTASSVVTAGGFLGDTILDSTELYTVATGKVSTGRAMNTARANHASVVLNDGTILVSGGLTGLPPAYAPTASVERYDPTQNLWSITSSMNSARVNHTMTKLQDGRVLVTGGMSAPLTALSTTEIYSTVTNLWTPAAPMHTARANHTAVLLVNGSVLVTGGGTGPGLGLSKAEIYNPTLNKWYDVPDMPYSAYGHAASLMDNGNVLVSGGSLFSSAVFDTGTDTWGPSAFMGEMRVWHTSTALSGGTVLVTGGSGEPAISSAEIYSSALSSWSPTSGDLNRARGHHRAVQLNSTTVLLTGGDDIRSIATEVATAYGKNGLAMAVSYSVGPLDNEYLIRSGNGSWSIPMSIAYLPNTFIYDLLVAHGRLFASTGDAYRVYVARASPSGAFVSNSHAFGAYATNITMGWTAISPSGTSLKFQVKSARSQQALASADFLGPDGTNATYFTTSGLALGKKHLGNNWFQYKAVMSTTNGKVTPILQDVSLTATIEPLTLKKVVVTPANATITADQNLKFNATGYDQFGTQMKFTPVWSAEGGSIDTVTGNYTPRLVGKWKVNAIGIGATGMTNLTVTPGALATIKIDPDKWVGTTDDTKLFVAHGSDAKGNVVNFTPKWVVNGGGAISQDGNFSPSRVGTWTVYANETISGISGNATVTITSGSPANILTEPSSAQVLAGDHKQFKATVYDKDGNILEFPVEWRVQGGGFITPTGDFTAQKTGFWKIYANLTQYKLSSEITVTVKPGPLTNIQVRPDEANVKAGDTLNLTGMPLDALGNVVDVTIQWAVTGGGPISNGIYQPTRSGIFTVYANASGLSATALVHVLPAALFKVVVTPGETNVTTGNQAIFSARCEDRYGNVIPELKIYWRTDIIGIGNIDSTGAFTAGTKKMSGTVTATATYNNATVSGSAIVSVVPPKKPAEEVVPAYYGALKLVIIIVLIAVAALALVEFTRKGSKEK
jgi:hypothetical protein